LQTDKGKMRGAGSSDISGAADGAETMAGGSGSTKLTHGIMVDSLRRTTPTHLTSWTTRRALFSFDAGHIPWYNPENLGVAAETSVAEKLFMTVKDAELWERGNSAQISATENAVLKFSDVPFSSRYIARQKFFALDPDAAELDDQYMLEPQIFALDEMSQLLSESASFHFGFLADLDDEYHRLRPHGRVGVFNESSEETPWYNLYHYWREELRKAYLNTGLVTLPSGLEASNWTIKDILVEIRRFAAPDGNTLLDDIVLTEKGVAKGQTTAAYGLQTDAAYTDADGNSRMYVPWMMANQVNSLTTNNNIQAVASPVKISVSSGTVSDSLWDNHASNDQTVMPGMGVGSALGATYSTFNVPNRPTLGFNGDFDYTAGLISLSAALENNPVARDTVFQPASVFAERSESLATTTYTELNNAIKQQGYVGRMLTNIRSINQVPSQLGSNQMEVITWGDNSWDDAKVTCLPYVQQEEDGLTISYAYYTGHSLNLIQLIEMARKIGRALEGEISAALAPAFGKVSSFDALVNRGTGLKARDLPVLYNMYEAAFSFNENPAREYTAAHMGPSSLVLPASGPDALKIENVTLATPPNTTVRERYWTPSVMDSSMANEVVGALFGRSEYAFGLLGDYRVSDASFTSWDALDRAMLSRTLGTTFSMYSKVEKPLVLPAGVAAGDSTYASGLGRGAIELVGEMVHGSLGAVPRFGLGMGGFSDIKATTTASFTSAGVGGVQYEVVPVNRLERMLEEANDGDGAGPVATVSGYFEGGMGSDLADAIEVAPGGFDYLDAISNVENVVEGLLEFNELGLAVASPSRGFRGAEAGPQEFLSAGNAPLLTSKIVETSLIDLRAQWGFVETDASNWTAGMAAFNSDNPVVCHEVVTPKAVRINTDVGMHELDYTEATLSEWYDDVASITGDPYFATNNYMPSSSSYYVLKTATGARRFGVRNHSSGALKSWFPAFTPLQLITATYQALASAYASPLVTVPKPLWQDGGSGDGAYKYLDVELELSHQVGTAGPNRAAGTAYGGGRAETTWQMQLRIPNSVSSPRGVDISATGVFSPTVGEDITRTLDIELFNTMTLHWMGATTVAPTGFDSTDALNITWNGTNGISVPDTGEQVTLAPTTGAVFYDPYGDPANSYSPPIDVGAELSRNSAYLLAAPETMLAHRGTWLSVALDAKLNLNHHLSAGALSLTQYGGSGHYHEFIRADSVGQFWGDNGFSDIIIWKKLDGGVLTTLPIVGNTRATLHYVQDAVARPSDYGSLVDGALGSFVIVSKQSASDDASTTTFNFMGVLGGINWGQVSLIYPDDPEHRMLYRPWRTIVDAAVAKELKLTFANLGDENSHLYGPLGIETIGTPTGFRFEQMVKAGPRLSRQFILDKAGSMTRMTNPAERGSLIFTKVKLTDPNSRRHVIPDILREYNALMDGFSEIHAQSAGGKRVYTRDYIRDVQSGRQFQRLG